MPRDQIVPRPAHFFFDASRAGLHPTLVAAMTLAYDWADLNGTPGFVTRQQLNLCWGQISAHGIPIDSVIQDLLSAGQLELVGAGFQLPLLHNYERRAQKAAASRRSYHEKGRRDRNSRKAYRARNDPERWDGTGVAPVARPKAPKRYPDAIRNEPESGVFPVQRPVTPRDQTPKSVNSVSDPNLKPDSRPDTHTHSHIPFASDVDANRNKYPTSTPSTESVGSGTSHFESRGEQSAEADPSVSPTPSAAPTAEPEPPDLDALDEMAAKSARGSECRDDAEAQLSPEAAEALKRVMQSVTQPVSSWTGEGRKRHCTRRLWAPPAWLVANWVNRLPIEQIVKDVGRYHRAGKYDLVAAEDHDRMFESFLSSSVRWNHRKHEQSVAIQNECFRAEARAKKQSAEADTETKTGTITRPRVTRTSIKPYINGPEKSLASLEEVLNVG